MFAQTGLTFNPHIPSHKNYNSFFQSCVKIVFTARNCNVPNIDLNSRNGEGSLQLLTGECYSNSDRWSLIVMYVGGVITLILFVISTSGFRVWETVDTFNKVGGYLKSHSSKTLFKVAWTQSFSFYLHTNLHLLSFIPDF